MKNSKYVRNPNINIESNISDNGFEITDSKARLIYRDFISIRKHLTCFTSCISFFTSTLICLLTSDFKDIFEIENSHYIIKGFFVAICCASAIASIIAFVIIFIKRKRFNEDSFILELHKTGNTKIKKEDK